MKKFLALLTAIAIILCGCKATPDSLNKKGEKLLKNEDWDGALECFEQMIELKDTDERGYLGSAKAYRGMKKLEDAVKILEKGKRDASDTDDIKDMIKSLQEDIWGEEVSEMNATAEAMRDEIQAYLTELNALGYTLNRDISVQFNISAFEKGEIWVSSAIINCLDPFPIGMDVQLSERLNDKFPEIEDLNMTVVYGDGSIIGLQLVPIKAYGYIDWDSEKSVWICEDAKSSGVTSDGLVFGTYPPHRVD